MHSFPLIPFLTLALLAFPSFSNAFWWGGVPQGAPGGSQVAIPQGGTAALTTFPAPKTVVGDASNAPEAVSGASVTEYAAPSITDTFILNPFTTTTIYAWMPVTIDGIPTSVEISFTSTINKPGGSKRTLGADDIEVRAMDQVATATQSNTADYPINSPSRSAATRPNPALLVPTALPARYPPGRGGR